MDAEGVVAVPAGSRVAAYQTLEVTVEDNITTIRLNRPEKKNAITTQVRASKLVSVSVAMKPTKMHHHLDQCECEFLLT